MEANWTEVGSTEDVPDENWLSAIVDDTVLLIFRSGDQYCCIEDLCTHDGGTLSDGQRQGNEMICPRHGARFDICDGRALCMPATAATRAFPTRVENGRIYVNASRTANKP